ncbi:hypothetical protein SDC9_61500 [bioreactor metagenome]|uniref:Uncharacterized protein n=1 Tax=bioreactor metagenome TaxID=1076179 RepID=A0A644XM11_9ZZZZ
MAIVRSRWKIPKAPLMINNTFSRAQPTRPVMKERMYSRLCSLGRNLEGRPIESRLPSSTSQPLTGHMLPPLAMVSVLLSSMTETALSRASGSKSESASMPQKNCLVATFSPKFKESALPPLTLSTTTRLGMFLFL